MNKTHTETALQTKNPNKTLGTKISLTNTTCRTKETFMEIEQKTFLLNN